MAAIERGYVIISGAPGAGKSTIAAPLAAALGLPLIGKDMIKETLHDHIPAVGDRSGWSRTLGGAAMEVIWTMAAAAPAAVLESDFRPRSDYERGKLAGLGAPLVEIYCRCPPELAAARYAARHETRHPAHVRSTVTLDMLAEFDTPVGLGPVIEVDTSGAVDVAGLSRAVLAAFGPGR